jgi:parallel beta-helix repeat protein/predicted outer membrane repeat protein
MPRASAGTHPTREFTRHVSRTTAALTAGLLLAVTLLPGCGSDSAPPAGPDGIEIALSGSQVQITQTVEVDAAYTYARNGTPACDWYVDGVLGGDAEKGTITQGNPATYTAPTAVPAGATVEISAVDRSNDSFEDAGSVTVLFTILYVDDATGIDAPGGGALAAPLRTIGYGLGAVDEGDTVEVMPGTYSGLGNRDLDFDGKAVVLRSGGGARSVTIDCQAVSQFAYIEDGEGADTVIDGFTITNGYAEFDGGAIFCDGTSPTIRNCTFSNGHADYMAGAICFDLSSAVLIGCTFTGNTSDEEGAVLHFTESTPTLVDCTFSGNASEFDGGAIYGLGSSVTLTNCTFSDNSAVRNGGALYSEQGSAIVTGCTFSGNSSGEDGGAIWYDELSPILTNCQFTGNSCGSGDGGAAWCANTSPIITGCEFTGNTSGDDGGGLYCDAASPILTGCEFSDNSAGYAGGGFSCVDSTPLLTNCTFSDNTADDYGGGGMHCQYSYAPILTNCTFSENDTPGRGAGLFLDDNYSPATLTGCTFSVNSANSGGGMETDGSSPTLTYCTFVGNLAESGGGLYASDEASGFSVQNCTFAGNWAAGGGGLTLDDASPTIGHTIIATSAGGEAIYCADPSSDPSLTCCDVYGNAGGDWVGCIADQGQTSGNMSEDPLFCNEAGGDLTLDALSPCAAANSPGCGLIGARDVGCGR